MYREQASTGCQKIVSCLYREKYQHWSYKFLISGQFYNECDNAVGLVELKKRKAQRDLFDPGHWAERIGLINNRKFLVVICITKIMLILAVKHLNCIGLKSVMVLVIVLWLLNTLHNCKNNFCIWIIRTEHWFW